MLTEIIIFIIITIVFLSICFPMYNGNEEVDDYYNFPEEPKEEKLYHPTTGYSCKTWDEMQTYISNRERKLKKNENN